VAVRIFRNGTGDRGTQDQMSEDEVVRWHGLCYTMSEFARPATDQEAYQSLPPKTTNISSCLPPFVNEVETCNQHYENSRKWEVGSGLELQGSGHVGRPGVLGVGCWKC
jgi:hypothetical protein